MYFNGQMLYGVPFMMFGQIRAICDYGITESEMKRYMDAMLKDSVLHSHAATY